MDNSGRQLKLFANDGPDFDRDGTVKAVLSADGTSVFSCRGSDVIRLTGDHQIVDESCGPNSTFFRIPQSSMVGVKSGSHVAFLTP